MQTPDESMVQTKKTTTRVRSTRNMHYAVSKKLENLEKKWSTHFVTLIYNSEEIPFHIIARLSVEVQKISIFGYFAKIANYLWIGVLTVCLWIEKLSICTNRVSDTIENENFSIFAKS